MVKSSHIKITLSQEDVDYIKDKCVQEGWTDKKIAEVLNRSPGVVAKYRKKFSIVKTIGGAVKTNLLPAHAINKASLTKEQKAACWLQVLMKSQRYARMKQQLTEEHLDFFADRWAYYCIQFDDLSPAEESQLETLISFEIRLAENRKAFTETIKYEKDIMKQLGGNVNVELSLENEKDRFLYEMIANVRKLQQENTEEFNRLTAQHERYFEMLNATRVQREENEKIGADTFLTLVRQLTDADKRREIGKYNELMKIATKKQKNELKKPHKFIDDQYSPIIMEGKDYIPKEENKNE